MHDKFPWGIVHLPLPFVCIYKRTRRYTRVLCTRQTLSHTSSDIFQHFQMRKSLLCATLKQNAMARHFLWRFQVHSIKKKKKYVYDDWCADDFSFGLSSLQNSRITDDTTHLSRNYKFHVQRKNETTTSLTARPTLFIRYWIRRASERERTNAIEHSSLCKWAWNIEKRAKWILEPDSLWYCCRKGTLFVFFFFFTLQSCLFLQLEQKNFHLSKNMSTTRSFYYLLQAQLFLTSSTQQKKKRK